MSQTLEPVNLAQAKDRHKKRWKRARPGNAFINPHDDIDGKYAVRCEGGDWHNLTLIRSLGQFFAHCDCQGFDHHDGPCAHILAVFRLESATTDDWGYRFAHYPPQEIVVDMERPQQELADHQSEPEVREA